MIKNGSISEQIKMQERMNESTNSVQHDAMNSVSQSFNQSVSQLASESTNQSTNSPDLELSSALGVFSPEVHGEDIEELKKQKEINRKKGNRGLK